MPAWNEAEGLPTFIQELNSELSRWHPQFVVVDDHSTDETAIVIEDLAKSGINLKLIVNEKNSGHGPSTLKALRAGLGLHVDFVIAVDGDGQCYGQDLARMVEILETSDVEVVEGIRIARNDPFYRKMVSLAVRILVSLKSKELPTDANTPFRAYRVKNLSQIIGAIPTDVMIPNLVISAVSRSWGLNIRELQIESIPRRGSNPNGSTWGKTIKAIPSSRFIKFCTSAALQWIFFTVPSKHTIIE
jgi:glycosyltransferase involved in cell wall biosynthesis